MQGIATGRKCLFDIVRRVTDDTLQPGRCRKEGDFMKTLFVGLMMVLLPAQIVAQPVTLDGVIGPYAIDVELSEARGALTGRYRYEGREAWIDLAGEAFGQAAARLEEQVDGEVTGRFFLETTETGFAGFWAGGDRSFPVELTVVQGTREALFPSPETEQVNESVTGKYSYETYWVNTLFAPNYEIGFNGGDVSVVEIGPNIIFVDFQFIVGPTYHFADFQGLATLTSSGSYVHDAVLSGGDSPCRLVFTFSNGTLRIEDDDNGAACQFGARAHANFSLPKVSDVAEFRAPL